MANEVVSSTNLAMDERTLTALKGSIAKWQAIVDGTGEDHGEENCPLCEAFPDVNCTGCPVKAKTGKRGCLGTPYIEWSQFDTCTVQTDEERDAACDELNFLISLLPPGEKP